MPNYKIILVGDGGVGKSTLFKRLSSRQFQTRYIPTLGVEINEIVFNTNQGPIKFEVWDTAGKEIHRGLLDGYAIGAHAVIGLCDLTSKESVDNMDYWYRMMNSRVLPSVACGNKFDLDPNGEKISEQKKMNLLQKWGMYYNISVKTKYDYEQPFLYLAQKLSNRNDLVFTRSNW